jgi:hypothetical protein
MQVHEYTYEDKSEEVEGFYFRFIFGRSHYVQAVDWILDVPS